MLSLSIAKESQGAGARRNRGLARKAYIDEVAKHQGFFRVAAGLQPVLRPSFDQLPLRSWLGFEIEFTLEAPFYSKDDRAFHPLDNPLRKDRHFGVPFLSATAWKGLLRWACCLTWGKGDNQLEHLRQEPDFEKRPEPDWLVHLFGNEHGAAKSFSQGALRFYPTFFEAPPAFELINPHNRDTKAGTQPIHFEVVPAGTSGVLRLLYAPLPKQEKYLAAQALPLLLEAIQELLQDYGISAKRTTGWGAAKITNYAGYGMADVEQQTAAPKGSKVQERVVKSFGALKQATAGAWKHGGPLKSTETFEEMQKWLAERLSAAEERR